jgi:hypothetical protein
MRCTPLGSKLWQSKPSIQTQPTLLLTCQPGLLDRRSSSPMLYGAVSIGNVWQFGVLNRQPKQILQDINLYRVPADLEDLLRILIAILKNSH